MFEFPAALNVVWAQVGLSGPLESEKRFPAIRVSVLRVSITITTTQSQSPHCAKFSGYRRFILRGAAWAGG
jgi:hypothetical protein